MQPPYIAREDPLKKALKRAGEEKRITNQIRFALDFLKNYKIQ